MSVVFFDLRWRVKAVGLKVILAVYSLVIGATLLVSFLLPPAILFSPEPIDAELTDLAAGISIFEGKIVRTRGKVRFLLSYFQIEAFWLANDEPEFAAIPVVVSFSGYVRPDENASVEVTGKIRYGGIEGGFHYLDAISINSVRSNFALSS